MGADGGVRNNMNAPCKDCKDRRELCHANCETYKAFRTQQLKSYEVRRAKMEVQAAKQSFVEASLRRLRNRSHRR